jgi:Secretion system C-terminal sorting domain
MKKLFFLSFILIEMTLKTFAMQLSIQSACKKLNILGNPIIEVTLQHPNTQWIGFGNPLTRLIFFPNGNTSLAPSIISANTNISFGGPNSQVILTFDLSSISNQIDIESCDSFRMEWQFQNGAPFNSYNTSSPNWWLISSYTTPLFNNQTIFDLLMLCPCKTEKLCISNFVYTVNTNNGAVQFREEDNSNIGSDVYNELNLSTCIQKQNGNKMLLISDEWIIDDNNGNITQYNTNSFDNPTDYNMNTFLANPFLLNNLFGHFSVCHTKKIQIICTKFFPDNIYEYDLIKTLYDCKVCQTICIDANIFEKPITKDVNEPIGCVSSFSYSAATKSTGDIIITDNPNNILGNFIQNNIINTCTPGSSPILAIEDNFSIDDFTNVQNFSFNSIDNPSKYNLLDYTFLPFLANINAFITTEYKLCHNRVITILCVPNISGHGHGISYGDYLNQSISINEIYNCNQCVNGCVFPAVTTGIPGHFKDSKYKNFSIFPNPASTIINVNFETADVANIILTDVMGKVVYNKTATANNQINVANFANGVYSLSVITKEGTYTSKINVAH